jgi:hypothetical protein
MVSFPKGQSWLLEAARQPAFTVIGIPWLIIPPGVIEEANKVLQQPGKRNGLTSS